MSSARKKILVVDDEPVFSSILSANLEAHGPYSVTVVEDPRAAQETARKLKPDLIILDLVMPGLGGDELVERFEKDVELSHIPVLFITGLPSRAASLTRPTLRKTTPVDRMLEVIEKLASGRPTAVAERSA